MKKTMVLGVMAYFFGAHMVAAEPLVLEQATNVLAPKTLEIGLADIGYQSDVTSIIDSGGKEVIKLTNTETFVPLFAKYSLTSRIETNLYVPYISARAKSEISGVSTTSSDSGLGDSVLAAKVNLLDKEWQIGLKAGFSLPTGSTEFKRGLNITPLVALRRDAKRYLVNINISYENTGKYDDNNTSLQLNPGDILSAGLGLEIPGKKVEGLTYCGEFVYQSISASKVAGLTQSGSSGERMDMNLGFRYNVHNLKTKVGLVLALGDEQYRTHDYKILAAITYVIKN